MSTNLWSVAWKVTERCNSRCVTCLHWREEKDELDTIEALNLIDQVFGSGIGSFRLTGGEPTLREDLKILVDRILECGGRANLNSNLLDISNLPEKLHSLVVPFDGFYETYEKIRGVNGTDRVCANLEKVKGSYPITLTMILMDDTIDELPWVIKYCKKIGAKLGFNLIDSTPYFFKDERNISAVKDWEVIVDKILEHYDPKVFHAPEWAIIDIPRFYSDKPPACQIPLKNIKIDSIGQVYAGCWSVDPIGWLRTKNLKDILESEPYRRTVHELVKGNCPNCTCGWIQRC